MFKVLYYYGYPAFGDSFVSIYLSFKTEQGVGFVTFCGYASSEMQIGTFSFEAWQAPIKIFHQYADFIFGQCPIARSMHE